MRRSCDSGGRAAGSSQLALAMAIASFVIQRHSQAIRRGDAPTKPSWTIRAPISLEKGAPMLICCNAPSCISRTFREMWPARPAPARLTPKQASFDPRWSNSALKVASFRLYVVRIAPTGGQQNAETVADSQPGGLHRFLHHDLHRSY